MSSVEVIPSCKSEMLDGGTTRASAVSVAKEGLWLNQDTTVETLLAFFASSPVSCFTKLGFRNHNKAPWIEIQQVREM